VQSPQTSFLVSDNWIQCIYTPNGLNTGVYLLEVATYAGESLGMVKVMIEK
jgi:hypothetical protein